MQKGFSIAIDGPVAAGKGTIAPKLARKLNGFYLYTGAMYRCVALYCLKNNIDLDNEKQVEEVLSYVDVDFTKDKILLNKEDVTDKIKEEVVAMSSSKVALYEKVRKELVFLQKRIVEKALRKGITVVAEGRDTGTKVMPNADLKVFLTASPKIRAQRRLEQIIKRGEKEDFETVLEDVLKRDKQDSEREIDPLVKDPKAFGYFVLDDSEMSEEETIEEIIKKIK